MSSLPRISHHLFVAAAGQENNPGSKTKQDGVPPSAGLDEAVVEGSPGKWNGFARPGETMRLLSASVIGGGSS
jgi:hypothetical protein